MAFSGKKNLYPVTKVGVYGGTVTDWVDEKEYLARTEAEQAIVLKASATRIDQKTTPENDEISTPEKSHALLAKQHNINMHPQANPDSFDAWKIPTLSDREDILHSVLSKTLDSNAKAELALTQQFAGFTNYRLFSVHKELRLKMLLTHIVRGNKLEAEVMLRSLSSEPELLKYLLTTKYKVRDYSGRVIEGTAYQIALGAEDISRKEHPEEGMADLLRPYFIQAFGNDEATDEEMSKQFKEQFPEKEFPEYYEADEKKREDIIIQKNANDPDLAELDKVANAIRRAADAKEVKAIPTGKTDEYGDEIYNLEISGECAKALQAFRDYLKPKGVIAKGKHFNPQLLIKALEKYAGQQYDDFGGNWYDAQNLLFWRQVIGYIERYLPANYAQAFCQGLYKVTNGGEALKRDLKLVDKSFFYPSNLNSFSGLGFDHSVYSQGGGQEAGGGPWGGAVHWADVYKTCVKQKQQSFARLCGIPKIDQSSCCTGDTVVLSR